MEKLNFVKNGVIRLPPGFRFHPTDEELIVQYLRRKVYSCPLPASIILDVDVCKSDPWDLPGDLEQQRYFFSTKEAKYPNGKRSNRATVSGYWKATGIDRQVVARNQVVGMKKTLVFYRGKPPHGSKTDWIMHEYRLATPTSSPTEKIDLNQNAVTLPSDDWVLCRIFMKKRNAAKSTDEEHHNVNVQTADYDRTEDSTVTRSSNKNKPEPVIEPVFYDFMAREKTDLNLVPTSPYSGSSGVTEVSICNGTDDNEESSCNTNSNRSIPFSRRKP